MRQADIVVTNPPFSLWREYIALLMEHQKRFLIIGPMNVITYKEVFPLLQGNRLWLGNTAVKSFLTPGGAVRKFGNVFWYTNLDCAKRHTPLPLYCRYSPELYPIFKDVHEPIIPRATWEKIQEKRGKLRKRRTHEGERNMFSGLLVCADCGNNLHFHFNQGNPEIEYFNCSNYKGNRGTCPSTHYIRADFLEQILLAEIRRLTRFVSKYEKEFATLMMGFTQQAAEDERKLIQKELDAAKARDRELDTLFERIYEDNVAGKLTDERFARMSAKYEDEQKELREKIKTLQERIERTKSKAVTADMFVSAVRKYTRAKKLTPRMLNELVQRIEVHQAEKVDGVWVQRLTIHYNCVGAITIPENLPLPMPDITVNTRKGVYVSYQPDSKAG